jgi:4'-phosphopantetheinyl transferase EntD
MRTLISTLFRADAVTVEAPPELRDEELFPEERKYIERAVPKRRAEFAVGRICARRGLARMGIAPVALVPKDGGPEWPPGVVGSISHTRERCAVVLERSPPMRSVGLDIEIVRPLEEGVLALTLTGRERAWLRTQPEAAEAELAILFFSAKEAYYKCQYPLTRTFLDFQDVEIDIAPESGRFVARLLKAGVPRGISRLEGRFAVGEGSVFCGMERAFSSSD